MGPDYDATKDEELRAETIELMGGNEEAADNVLRSYEWLRRHPPGAQLPEELEPGSEELPSREEAIREAMEADEGREDWLGGRWDFP